MKGKERIVGEGRTIELSLVYDIQLNLARHAAHKRRQMAQFMTAFNFTPIQRRFKSIKSIVLVRMKSYASLDESE